MLPAGCTQYFYGDDSGTVKTYNYAGKFETRLKILLVSKTAHVDNTSTPMIESNLLILPSLYSGGRHLANQNQVQCIRREKGNCRICYAAVAETDFGVSGSDEDMKFAIVDCCSYGADGKCSRVN